MARLFISQNRLDEWNTENKLRIDGEKMTIIELGRTFLIKPAVYFVKVAGSDADPEKLVGTVKDEEALVAMGADHMADSVIYGDVAYVVETGFIGEPV